MIAFILGLLVGIVSTAIFYRNNNKNMNQLVDNLRAKIEELKKK